MRKFYSYITDDPSAPGMQDEPFGSFGRSFDERNSVADLVAHLRKVWVGKSFKIFSYANLYDMSTYKLEWKNHV